MPCSHQTKCNCGSRSCSRLLESRNNTGRFLVMLMKVSSAVHGFSSRRPSKPSLIEVILFSNTTMASLQLSPCIHLTLGFLSRMFSLGSRVTSFPSRTSTSITSITVLSGFLKRNHKKCTKKIVILLLFENFNTAQNLKNQSKQFSKQTTEFETFRDRKRLFITYRGR